MATLYEYYNTGDSSYSDIYSSNWRAQTFTPATAHKITSIKLLLYRAGSPGTVTVSIRATDGSGHPTGADLCSGTFDGATLTTSTAGEWKEITLGAGYNLSASTKYAIVVRAAGANTSNSIKWRRDADSPTYSGGNHENSSDSGASWTAFSPDSDYMFEDWGEPLVTAKTSSDTGSGADAYDLLETGEAKSSSDTGSGADAVVSLQTPQAKTSSDVGAGAEGTPTQSAVIATSEGGSGLEALIARLLTDDESGSAVEAAQIVGLLKDLFASEAAEGADRLAAKIEIPVKGGGMKLWT